MNIADYIIVISSPLVLYSFYWNVIGSLNEILSRDYDAQYLLCKLFRNFGTQYLFSE